MVANLNLLDKLSVIHFDLAPKVLTFVFLVLTAIFIAFISLSDIKGIRYFIEDNGTTKGYIDKIEGTNTYLNNSEVLGYYFSYSVNGESFYAESFSHNLYFDEGEEVQVEYLTDDPYVARIIGTNSSSFGPWPVLIIGFVWLIVTVITFIVFRKTTSTFNILQKRIKTTGIKRDVVKTNVEINESPVYNVEYEYETLGNRYKALARTTNPYNFQDEEPLFFSKDNPSKSVLLKRLPKRVLRKLTD